MSIILAFFKLLLLLGVFNNLILEQLELRLFYRSHIYMQATTTINKKTVQQAIVTEVNKHLVL